MWVGEPPDWAWQPGDPLTPGTQQDHRSTPRVEDLAEVAASLQVEISGEPVEIRVYRDGLIEFDFTGLGPDEATDSQGNLTDERARRLRVMNAHFLCLYARTTRFFHLQVLTSLDVLAQRGNTRADNTAWRGGRVWDLLRERHWSKFPWGTYPTLRLGYIPQLEIEGSFTLFQELCERPNQDAVLWRMEMLLRSVEALNDEDYPGALVSAWTAVEAMLRILWERYLTDRATDHEGQGDKRQFLNSDRKGFLNGPQITSRHMAEILSLADRLAFGLYRDIVTNGTRRNNWLHTQKPIDRKQACDAIQTAQALHGFVDGVKLEIPLQRRIA